MSSPATGAPVAPQFKTVDQLLSAPPPFQVRVVAPREDMFRPTKARARQRVGTNDLVWDSIVFIVCRAGSKALEACRLNHNLQGIGNENSREHYGRNSRMFG